MEELTFLNWPFFEAGHREFATRLQSWLGQGYGEKSHDTYASSGWVTALAGGGFLQACLDLDVRTICLARELLAKHDALADFAFAMQGLGSAPISLFGTQAQKSRFLPGVAQGTAIAAFAISEADAGSDVAALKTRARRSGDAYLIDGEKMWISNAGIATFYIVFARTGDAGSKGISAFAVDAASDGLQAVGGIETISPHPLGTVRFTQCRVPIANRLGEEGQGFKIAMATLDTFRASVGAAAIGFASRAFEAAVAHVRDRRMFGQRLADLQMTQGKIAQMATSIDASRLLVFRAAYAKDRGAERVTREAAMAKWFATETASRVADAAVQLFGGKGVVAGNTAEQAYRDARALRIYEGASEIQQIVIARSVVESS